MQFHLVAKILYFEKLNPYEKITSWMIQISFIYFYRVV